VQLGSDLPAADDEKPPSSGATVAGTEESCYGLSLSLTPAPLPPPPPSPPQQQQFKIEP